MNRRHFTRLVTGVATASLPLAAFAKGLVDKRAEDLANGEFNWYPERSHAGPLVIIVSIPDQRVHVYRNGIRVAASSCSTGKQGHATPTGVFKILQKDKHHKSSTYNNAPMPNMNRLTWSGVALHAGNLPGYPASHGCVRLPLEFSDRLFGITKLGMTVVIADARSFPNSVVHPGMVLGDYAAREFAAVDRAIKQSAYAQVYTDNPRAASVVVSSKDRSVSVWENGQVVASGSVEIENPAEPLGDNAYTLTGAYEKNNSVRWTKTNFGSRYNQQADSNPLRRVRADPQVREAIRQRMQHGMTVVTTDESSGRQNQTDEGFVVLSGLY